MVNMLFLNNPWRNSQNETIPSFPRSPRLREGDRETMLFNIKLPDPVQVVHAFSEIVMALCRSGGSREFVSAGTPAGTSLRANVPNDLTGGSGSLNMLRAFLDSLSPSRRRELRRNDALCHDFLIICINGHPAHIQKALAAIYKVAITESATA